MNLNNRRHDMSKKALVAVAVLSGLLFAGSLFGKIQLVHYGHPILGLAVMTVGIVILVVPIIILPRMKKNTNATTKESP